MESQSKMIPVKGERAEVFKGWFILLLYEMSF